MERFEKIAILCTLSLLALFYGLPFLQLQYIRKAKRLDDHRIIISDETKRIFLFNSKNGYHEANEKLFSRVLFDAGINDNSFEYQLDISNWVIRKIKRTKT